MTPDITVYDIPTFCKEHKISKPFLYKLIKNGKGPRLMKVGRRTLISLDAARKWRIDMEQATEQAIA